MEIDKTLLVSYLYGELPEQELLKVQKALEQDATLRKELEDLKQMRNILGQLPEKHPSVPLVLMNFGNAEGNFTQKKQRLPVRFNGFTQGIMALAASVALILVLGAITELQISHQNNELRIGFGKPNNTENIVKQEVKPQNNTKTQIVSQNTDTNAIKQLVNQELEQKQSNWEAQMASLKSQLSQKTYVSGERSFSKQDVESLVQQIRQEDFDLMQKMLSVNSEQQKDFLEKSLTAYAQFWEKQRKKDLSEIGETIVSFKQQTDDKIKDNDLILSRLISNQK
jgi:hypothetical protein